MKKLLFLMMSTAFVLTFGLARAEELYNGVTDFTGKSYEEFEISMTGPGAMNTIESSGAGGVRSGEADKELYNGVTDFTGKSYEEFEIGTTGPSAMNTIEGSGAGGVGTDEADKELYNGVTDFSGYALDVTRR